MATQVVKREDTQGRSGRFVLHFSKAAGCIDSMYLLFLDCCVHLADVKPDAPCMKLPCRTGACD